jgi:PTH1 family peptidyl-tRNA hydrolase
MRLLVGLGNPGPAYAGHRHNIGFMAVDAVARHFGFDPFRRRFQGAVAQGEIAGERIIALKPETFMNESGRAAGEAARYFKLEASDVIAFHDELDLKPGKVRVKTGGGAAGHNGLRSLDAHIGSDYVRVRLGIGHPGSPDRVTGFVLSDFTAAERLWRDPLLAAVAEALPLLINGDATGFMTRVAHQAPPPPAPGEEPN